MSYGDNCKSGCKGATHSCCPDCGMHSFSFYGRICLYCNSDRIFKPKEEKVIDENKLVKYYKCSNCNREIFRAKTAKGTTLKMDVKQQRDGDYDLVESLLVIGGPYKVHKC